MSDSTLSEVNNNITYAGVVIRTLIDKGEEFKIPYGTILVLELEQWKVFFEVKEDWVFHPHARQSAIKVLAGSSLVITGGEVKQEDAYYLAQYVRVPTHSEFLWYEQQNVI